MTETFIEWYHRIEKENRERPKFQHPPLRSMCFTAYPKGSEPYVRRRAPGQLTRAQRRDEEVK